MTQARSGVRKRKPDWPNQYSSSSFAALCSAPARDPSKRMSLTGGMRKERNQVFRRLNRGSVDTFLGIGAQMRCCDHFGVSDQRAAISSGFFKNVGRIDFDLASLQTGQNRRLIY